MHFVSLQYFVDSIWSLCSQERAYDACLVVLGAPLVAVHYCKGCHWMQVDFNGVYIVLHAAPRFDFITRGVAPVGVVLFTYLLLGQYGIKQ